MSEAIKEKTSNKDQSPAQTYTLFDQNDIQITLNLPSALQLNPVGQECYPRNPTPEEGAPILHNNTRSPIESVTFTIKLEDVMDASKVIANVRWWYDDFANGLQTMTFTCEAVLPGETAICRPTRSGYSQVRWSTEVSIGRGMQSFSLTYGSLPPSPTLTGPIVQIG
ncbi:hypothetical protein NUH87_01015 [Pseudomonas batumici]|uniref:hypothetical protein n=1 Tax=Pseudomonas batumici TaxID=226910 RepID=UPI0030CD3743